MNVSDALHSGISRFNLEVASIKVRPVYWINTPDFAPGFRAAKGTPEEMQSEIQRIEAICSEVGEEINVNHVEDAKNFLFRNNIGIDCSGFAFHAINHALRELGLNDYSSSLAVPKPQLVIASRKASWVEHHELSSSEVNDLPEYVPLDWICKTFNKEPAFQVNVSRLCSDAASSPVDSVVDLSPGDLIYMGKNGKSKHVAVVSERDGDSIEVWDSYREDDGYGGVMPHEIAIVDKQAPLYAQRWSNFNTARYHTYAIRRPHPFTQ